jgi:electron transport complex protein RnfB
MKTENQIYHNLQKHLDRLPIGFPATKSGVEIRILKHLFTPEEAEVATQLSMIAEPLERIYRRVKKSGITYKELEQLLNRMVHKGIVMPSKSGGKNLYSNGPLAVGMYEFQVERLTRDFYDDMREYLDEDFGRELFKTKINQMRTIPIQKSIPVPEQYQVSDYDSIRKIIENAEGKLGVANCICRQGQDLVGKSCTLTDLRETCLLISSDAADYYVNMGIGRHITKEECLEILEKVQEAGLILQPLNSLRPEAICCCCGDCCGILTTIKKLPRPADYYATNYYAEINPDACTGCQTCMERCQLEAPFMTDGVMAINLDRCIGCGNCVVTCESNAIRLRKKETETVPPKDMTSLHMKILSKKISKWNLLKTGVKVSLKLKV